MEGSFDNWTTRQNMQRSGKDFTIVKLLPPGVYQVSTLHCLLSPHRPVTQCQGNARRWQTELLANAHRLPLLCSTSSLWMGSGSTPRTSRPCTTSAASSTMWWRCKSTCPTTSTASSASSLHPRLLKGGASPLWLPIFYRFPCLQMQCS